MNPVRPWGGRVVLAPGLLFYVGTASRAERHAHHAVQLVRVETGTVEVELPDRCIYARSAIVPAGTEHELRAKVEPLLILLVDAYGARGIALDRRARELLGDDVSELLDPIPFPALGGSPADAEGWCRATLRALGVDACDVHAPSRQTRLAIQYVERSLDGIPRITEAAAIAGSSATRLSHRFSEEVGLPFRRFVLWTRLKRAAEISRDGGDITSAAVAAGFSDAAHLSRTFRAMFGLSPSTILPFVEVTGSPWSK